MSFGDWRPIAIAPHDGQRILACAVDAQVMDIAEWCDDGWLTGDMLFTANHYSHWMPLPALPLTVIINRRRVAAG